MIYYDWLGAAVTRCVLQWAESNYQRVAPGVAEAAQRDAGDINQPADAEQTEGEQIKETLADFAYIEIVGTAIAQKDAQQKRDDLAFRACGKIYARVGRRVGHIGMDRCVVVFVVIIDDDGGSGLC